MVGRHHLFSQESLAFPFLCGYTRLEWTHWLQTFSSLCTRPSPQSNVHENLYFLQWLWRIYSRVIWAFSVISLRFLPVTACDLQCLRHCSKWRAKLLWGQDELMLGTCFPPASCLAYPSTLKMEATCYPETLVDLLACCVALYHRR
jgi:hypothetical protein